MSGDPIRLAFPRDSEPPLVERDDAPDAMLERLRAASDGLRRLNDVMVLIERADEEARDTDRHAVEARG